MTNGTSSTPNPNTTDGIGGHMFTDVEAAKVFLFAGAALLTIVSTKTGTRYTFKVTQAPKKDKRTGREVPDHKRPYFVKVLTGSNNESDYTYVGMMPSTGQARLILTQASKYNDDTTLVKAYRWMLTALRANSFGGLEIWHEGRCGRCGRLLTVPESISSGMGPICQGLAA